MSAIRVRAGGKTSSATLKAPRSALVAALCVFAACALGLSMREQATPLALARGMAIGDALHNPHVQALLRGSRWNTVDVTAVDARLARVAFFSSGRIVAQVAVASDGSVRSSESFVHRSVPYGNWIAYEPAMLIGLALVFIMMAGVWPWRRVRNLDVGAALSLIAPVVLIQHRFLDASVLAALPGLLYLLGRCLWTAFWPGNEPASAPLLSLLTAGTRSAVVIRWMRIALLVLAAIYLMVSISAPSAVDVAYAAMEGATKLLHGILPYGHMPGDVVHGDTYPLLTYLAYVPAALIAPVRSVWDSADAALLLAALTALGLAFVLYRGSRAGDRAVPSSRSEESGLRAAIAWLAFPSVLVTVSTGTTDVVLGAMLAVAVLLWRRPAMACGVLAAAAWFKLAPVLLLPLRLASLRGRALLRALAAVLVVSLPLLGLLLLLGGQHALAAMISAVGYQFSRGSPQSVWSILGLRSLQPLSQAAVLALVAYGAIVLRRSPQLALDRPRMAALAAAILIALQLSADYWAFLYVSWVAPLIVLLLLRPAAAPGVAPPAVLDPIAAPAAILDPIAPRAGVLDPVAAPAAGLDPIAAPSLQPTAT